MIRLFRSKSYGHSAPASPIFNVKGVCDDEKEDDEYGGESESVYYDACNPISIPFVTPASKAATGVNNQAGNSQSSQNQHQFPILEILVAALRKSLVTCSVEREDVSSMDISWPTEVRHVSHVTFDRFDGFLGLPTELELEVPRKAPSAGASVFGVSAKSMQCSFDDRGNSVPTILLMMQRQLYAEGGLKAEGIFRIAADNSQEEFVRNQLNGGVVPHGIDVHCLSGLIKAWFRELPAGILDCLTPEQVMHCNTEDDCTRLVKFLTPTEAALLDWAINLMADVVQHEAFNKMNARNIAMVFAPNMTQMADPLFALIHAVQVMNFLKTLILKTMQEREESASKSRPIPSCSDSATLKEDVIALNIKIEVAGEPTSDADTMKTSEENNFFRAATLGMIEWKNYERLWSPDVGDNDERESKSVSCSSTPFSHDVRVVALENSSRARYDSEHWLNLRKGVKKLCRHPVFQLTKPSKKTGSDIGLVITREGGGEAW